jgi:hypothetical protein
VYSQNTQEDIYTEICANSNLRKSYLLFSNATNSNNCQFKYDHSNDTLTLFQHQMIL